LVTLLIGVNNQYQNRPFSTYEKEFLELVAIAIKAGKNIASNLIVVSNPDYAITPFGNGSTSISREINKYNTFAKNYYEQNGITFVNITEISRNGLTNPSLVASDGLHSSELAYTKFVASILPIALQKLN
jgi:acyl-CoA thioesterase-1